MRATRSRMRLFGNPTRQHSRYLYPGHSIGTTGSLTFRIPGAIAPRTREELP